MDAETCPQPASPWGKVEANAWSLASLGLVNRLRACDSVAIPSASVMGVTDGDSSVVTAHTVEDPRETGEVCDLPVVAGPV